MGQIIQETMNYVQWTKYILWRTAFKKLIEQCRGIFKNQQISKIELFAKILPVSIFTKSSILDIRQGSK